MHMMTDKEHCPSIRRDVLHLVQALLLELRIPDRQYFVDDQDLSSQVRCYCESKTDVHAAAITLHRCVDEFFDTGEIHNRVELLPDFVARHSQNRTIEEDIFATCELLMKTCADFQQAANAAIEINFTGRHLGYAG